VQEDIDHARARAKHLAYQSPPPLRIPARNRFRRRSKRGMIKGRKRLHARRCPCPQLSFGTEPVVLCGAMRRLPSFPVEVGEQSDFLVSDFGGLPSGRRFDHSVFTRPGGGGARPHTRCSGPLCTPSRSWRSPLTHRRFRFRLALSVHLIPHPQKHRFSATWVPPSGKTIITRSSI